MCLIIHSFTEQTSAPVPVPATARARGGGLARRPLCGLRPLSLAFTTAGAAYGCGRVWGQQDALAFLILVKLENLTMKESHHALAGGRAASCLRTVSHVQP